MKGVIAQCLAELVCDKFGKEKWEAILVNVGMNKKTKFLATQDLDDAAVIKVVQETCNVLGINMQQAAGAFGEYWVNAFAPKIYNQYYKGVKSARDFLMKMDDIHLATTKSMANAKPPRFEYEQPSENVLIMKYKSHRNLIDFLVGLIEGVGKYFKEKLKVEKLENDRVRIEFLK